MFDVHFRTALFSDPSREASDTRALLALVDALIAVDLAYLEWAGPGAPRLYTSGVRYVPEPPGVEIFADIPHVLAAGGGDCDDLVAWRVAELRHTREDPRAAVKLVAFPRRCPVSGRGSAALRAPLAPAQNEPCTLYHVQVRRGGGAVEDPSARLGMPTGHLSLESPGPRVAGWY